jgi:hypothetical protein
MTPLQPMIATPLQPMVATPPPDSAQLARSTKASPPAQVRAGRRAGGRGQAYHFHDQSDLGSAKPASRKRPGMQLQLPALRLRGSNAMTPTQPQTQTPPPPLASPRPAPDAVLQNPQAFWEACQRELAAGLHPLHEDVEEE